jgi:hypothetical protein
MSKPEAEISRDEIRLLAARAGYPVSAHQLVRWQKAGLLPRSRRQPNGRGLGTTSMYPAHALETVLVLAKAARGPVRSLDAMAWAAWYARRPVTPYIRRLLASESEGIVSQASSALEQFEAEIPNNPIDKAADDRKGMKFLGRLRRVYRPTLLKVFTEASIGHFSAKEYDEHDFDIIAQAFGQRKIHGDRAREWMAVFFEAWSEEANVIRVRETLERVTDAELEAIRDEVIEFWRVLVDLTGFPIQAVPFRLFSGWFVMRRVSPTASAMIERLFTHPEWPLWRAKLIAEIQHRTKTGEFTRLDDNK